MDLQDFFNSSKGWQTGMFLGRHAPPWFIEMLAHIVTGISMAQKSNLYRAVTSNLRVVFPDYKKRQIHRLFRKIIVTAGYVYYDLFKVLSKPEMRYLDRIEFDSEFEKAYYASKERGKGTLIVSGHIGNFDIPAIAFAHRYETPQLLTYPNPYSAHIQQNRIRNELGLYTTPANMHTVREAINRLLNNGIVATGVEWPDPNSNITLTFFGRPTRLVTAHIKLAMATGATLIPVYSQRLGKLRYRVKLMGEPIIPKLKGDRNEMVRYYAEQILRDLEKLIREMPEQWLMFRPLWPETAIKTST